MTETGDVWCPSKHEPWTCSLDLDHEGAHEAWTCGCAGGGRCSDPDALMAKWPAGAIELADV